MYFTCVFSTIEQCQLSTIDSPEQVNVALTLHTPVLDDLGFAVLVDDLVSTDTDEDVLALVNEVPLVPEALVGHTRCTPRANKKVSLELSFV